MAASKKQDKRAAAADELAALGERRQEATTELNEVTQATPAAVARGRAAGLTIAEMVDLTGWSRARLYQLAGKELGR